MVEKVESKEKSSEGVEVFNPLAHAKQDTNLDIEIGKFKADILEDDSIETPEEDNKPKAKPTKEIVKEEDIDDQDDTEPAGDNSEEVVVESKYPEEYTTLKSEIRNSATKIQEMIEELDLERPEKPSEDADEYAQEEYKRELKDYQRRAKVVEAKIKNLNARNSENAQMLQQMFVEAHPNENLKGFETYMLKNRYLMAGFLSGEADLETIYTMYKQQNGATNKLKSIKRVSKMVKDDSLGFTQSGVSKPKAKGNGLPAEYKYANMPMFANYVKDLLKDMKTQKNMPDGSPITYKTIETMCEQAYKYDVPDSEK